MISRTSKPKAISRMTRTLLAFRHSFPYKSAYTLFIKDVNVSSARSDLSILSFFTRHLSIVALQQPSSSSSCLVHLQSVQPAALSAGCVLMRRSLHRLPSTISYTSICIGPEAHLCFSLTRPLPSLPRAATLPIVAERGPAGSGPSPHARPTSWCN